MAAQGIILEKSERQAVIQAQVEALSEDGRTGGICLTKACLSEVANLVEAPTALLGSFDPAHLHLPREVLISVMKKHQRYFPVFKPASHVGRKPSQPRMSHAPNESELLPYFITVANQPSRVVNPSRRLS